MFNERHPAVEFAKNFQTYIGIDICFYPVEDGSRHALAEIRDDGKPGYFEAKAPTFETQDEAQHAADVINEALGHSKDRVTQLVAASMRGGAA